MKRTTCPHCRLPLGTADSGRLRDLARERAAFLLDLPTGRSARPLLLGGVVATAALSLVPTAGILTGLVLPLVQVFCIERSQQRQREALDTLHGLIYDLFSAFLFVTLVAAEGLAGATLGSLAALVTTPLFIAVWFLAHWRLKAHLRRMAGGLRPHPLALSALGLAGVLIVGPPVVVAVLLLASHLQPSPTVPPLMDPNDFLETLSTGAVLSLDLFLLPLWTCLGLVAAGFVAVPAALSAPSSWWLFGVATAGLAAEVVLDNALDRRRRFSRTLWPRIQFLLTPLTLLSIVLVLGARLPWWQQLTALAGALSLAGVIKFGGTEPIKRAAGLLPGSLAQRKVLLYTAPFRVVFALGLAYLAVKLPVVVTAALLIVAAGASVVLLTHLLIRWRARRASRIACAACGHRALRSARVCPSCHHPVLASQLAPCPPEVRTAVVKVAAACAWADGTLGDGERRILGALIDASGAEREVRAALAAHLGEPLDLADVEVESIPARYHDEVMHAAWCVSSADDEIQASESATWRELATRLRSSRASILARIGVLGRSRRR